MKIFISWSGERSRTAANALREWLPLVLHYVQPWLSDRDIAAGERWAVEIGRELEGTQFGIIVLTTDNLAAPWILFEAGALSKAFTASHVCPYLIDLDFKDVSGPLSQFQAKKSDQGSTLDLLQAINGEAPTPVEPARLLELYDALWPRLEAKLKSIPPPKAAEARGRSQAQVLEELVVATRRMEARPATVLAARSDLETPMSKGIPVKIIVDGQVPRFKDARTVTLPIENDLIKEFGGIAGLEIDDYAKGWHLRRPNGRIVTLEEARYSHGVRADSHKLLRLCSPARSSLRYRI